MDSGAARAQGDRGDRGAAGSGENLGPLRRAAAPRPDWLSRSLTSITERLSQRAAGSEPGAGNGTRAVSFQLSQGQPGLYSFVVLAIKEQSSSWGETRADPASRGWHGGGTAPPETRGRDRAGQGEGGSGRRDPGCPTDLGSAASRGCPTVTAPSPGSSGRVGPERAWGGAGTPPAGGGEGAGHGGNPPPS